MSMENSSVTIEIDGEKYDLVATIEAATLMSRQYGGLGKLYDKVKDVDVDAIALSVRAGLGDQADKFDDIGNSIYRSGMINLMPTVAEFVLLVANGGVKQSSGGKKTRSKSKSSSKEDEGNG